MVTTAAQNVAKEKILLLPTCRGLEIIAIDSIVRIQAISNYSKLFFIDGRSLVVAKVLSWFEKKFEHIYFIRLHRGHVVNIMHIRGWENFNKAEVVLANGERVLVSRRRTAEFKKAVYKYYGNGISANAVSSRRLE